MGKDRVDECGALFSQCVHDHLPDSPGAHEPLGAECAQVMRDKILGTLRDPGEVTDAELLRLCERGGEHEPRGIGERPRLASSPLRLIDGQPVDPQGLGDLEVEAEKVTAIGCHDQHPNDH